MKYLMILMTFFSFAGLEGQTPAPSKFGIDTTKHLPQGLAVNTKAPDFKGVNQYGDTVTLEESLKKGPVVLFFYRGHWCPVCSKYLQKMQDSLRILQDSGAVVIGVSPQVEKYSRKAVNRHHLQFEVISDSNDLITKAYDVLFDVTKGYNRMIKLALMTGIAKTNGDDQASLPVPATYIIDQQGVIVYRQFDYNYKNRASIQEILKHLPGAKPVRQP